MSIEELVEKVDWEKNGGVVPVVVQDTEGEVLTLAYMDREALRRTLETGYAHYYSRSQGRVRMKGEVSGNLQVVREIRVDCDSDALLLKVEPKGPACHTGNYSCFYRKLGEPERVLPMDYSLTILRELEELIRKRKESPVEGSYTSRLFREGRERIYKKFGEEAVEVLVAENREALIYETADMLYHLLVLLAYNDVSLGEVMAELRRRRK
ncbi:bifunctional phosphoribosyl-AMP cyclohydrolase/phosphoribosyl-ATP pyrophosphohydrolase [Thermococcus kodakarensis KOD1]|uniref:Histidine biosynthesis bifunctional protein HisIE n=1 Tax=Thermococcus kodakarensis (strain ATCC BAA-918 / JCM 12380 / KOD1) TaxID=69014 RepID=Q5JFU7_THEKO|nr:bifunctional phosphoribosyl-AMP cyclohydrolase/phosphoribosyl-ATP diphosphatase HisIE [Thermococcus kodakarensis]WCN28336.1 bifunctional phosphoribosyl-AMP cyclohydrolase/phosphoribosyl-ATP diphosphatase HisIE [Thermococcus kodakarensis]WCN30632.1 bifunctional phosphoribosyl-AMP cyclohydrolase/phosphoribosyl-ATP diphosphatase HisIE [Thermococcus kodakarensis]BAD84438.1 bifunctional phosphoribosyl-AMP cyclohydrolase/phosphoribosyl-ATP pyrophosphohydrolase [Thermococcus kodakarensis KOD1]